jgi:aconitate decarboxylase
MSVPMAEPRRAPTDPAGATGRLATWLANLTLDQVPEAVRERAKVLMISKITAHHEPEFDKKGAMGRGAVRLSVRFTDGAVLESGRQMSRSIAEPLSREEVVAKYRTLTKNVVDATRARRVEDMILNLETLSDVSELIALLAPPVEPVFA